MSYVVYAHFLAMFVKENRSIYSFIIFVYELFTIKSLRRIDFIHPLLETDTLKYKPFFSSDHHHNFHYIS